MKKELTLEEKVKDILKGNTGDLKAVFDEHYYKTLTVNNGYIGYGKTATGQLRITKYHSYISGKGIKVMVNKSIDNIYLLSSVGFAAVKIDDRKLTKNELSRFKQDKGCHQPRFKNTFKNYEAFSSRIFCEFKKGFIKEDLIKVVALLKLYNELYLKGDKVGCQLVNDAVKGLQEVIAE